MSRTRLILALTVLALTVFETRGPRAQAETPAFHGEIIWDKYEIPHIYGRTVEDVLYGYGYAQTKNHAETMLRKVAMARGRFAEYFGAGPHDIHVSNDIRARSYGITERAQKWFDEGTDEQKKYLRIFCAGSEAYMKAHGADLDPTLRKVLPVGPADILAATQYVVHFNMMLEQWNLPAVVKAWKRGKSLSSLEVSRRPVAGGSNGWALAPKKTANGRTILMGNPHLPWGVRQPIPDLDIYQWFEAHLVVGDPERPELNASGASFAGAPFIGVGFTDDIGWTHTNNTIKNVDLFEIAVTDANEYRFDGEMRRLDQRQEDIKVLQPDGRTTTKTVTIESSVHGPIVARRDDGHALALRVAGLDGASIVSQYWAMLRAHGLEEFNRASESLQMPFFSVIYADRQGNIMYLFGGKQPVRDGGSFDDYMRIQDGSSSKTLWTRTLPWSALPKTINPPGGFVQNSNDPPWSSTFPQAINPAAYPPWISPQRMEPRAQHGATFLMSKDKFTLDEVMAGRESTRLVLAERVLPDLIAAARASSDPMARQAAETLAAWDRTANASSKGGALFARWYERYTAPARVRTPRSKVFGFDFPAFREEWSPERPLATPVGLAQPEAALPALVRAAQDLLDQFGAMDVEWGAVYRVVLVSHDGVQGEPQILWDTPQIGAPDVHGPLRVIESFPHNAQRYAYGGDSYIQFVEFDRDRGAEGRALLVYGNSSRPKATHVTDQAAMFAAGKLRKVLRTRREVEANAVLTERY